MMVLTPRILLRKRIVGFLRVMFTLVVGPQRAEMSVEGLGGFTAGHKT